VWEQWWVEILAIPLTWHIAYTTSCGYRTSRDGASANALFDIAMDVCCLRKQINVGYTAYTIIKIGVFILLLYKSVYGRY